MNMGADQRVGIRILERGRFSIAPRLQKENKLPPNLDARSLQSKAALCFHGRYTNTIAANRYYAVNQD
jgi:hypothetical protein